MIGEAAKNQAAMNPRNTVFDVKYVFYTHGNAVVIYALATNC